MSYEAFNLALEQHVSSNFTTTPVQFENAPAPVNSGEWVAVSTVFGGAALQAIGGSVMESQEDGIVFFRVFVPDGAGSLRARQVADALVALMSNQFLSDAYFYQAYAVQAGDRDGYYQINVNAPFYRRVT